MALESRRFDLAFGYGACAAAMEQRPEVGQGGGARVGGDVNVMRMIGAWSGGEMRYGCTWVVGSHGAVVRKVCESRNANTRREKRESAYLRYPTHSPSGVDCAVCSNVS
jgi:hypothetical protein